MEKAKPERTLEALKTEAGGLEDELRRLRVIESLGELSEEEADRKRKIEWRLLEIRKEAEGVATQKREAHAERKRKAREAEERRLQEGISSRDREQRENALIDRVLTTRRERMIAHGLGGVSVGGQPKGSAFTVQCANKVEREIALEFDAECQKVIGFPASSVRDRDAEAYEFGVRFDFERGEIVSVGEPSPLEGLRSVPSLPV